MLRAIRAALLTLCAAGLSDAQTAPAFEVASVKEAPAVDGSGSFRAGCSGGPGTPNPTAYNCYNSDLQTLIMKGYGLARYQLPSAGASGAVRYNVMARVPAGATADQVKLMLQTLLADRFQLKWHFEKKEMPTYQLTVARDGPKLRPAPADPAPVDGPPTAAPDTKNMSKDEDGFPIPDRQPGLMLTSTKRNGLKHIVAFDITMDSLATLLASELDQPVTNATGLQGKYDVTLTFLSPRGPTVRALSPGAAADAAVTSEPVRGLSISAAIQKYLGLTLQSGKAMIDVVAIDHAAKIPTEN